MSEGADTRRVGLVLGAGGTVGLSYHAGVLRALENEAGVQPALADVIIGTSAGSVIAAYLRSGWTTADLWDLAMGTHPILAGLTPDEVDARRAELFTPNFDSLAELLRRGVGSAFVLARSMWRLPAPVAPLMLRRQFPGGLFHMTEGSRRFTEDLPTAWPDRALWLCALDIISGRRVVLGRPGAPFIDLPTAVRASCAIPGFYPPVRAGNKTLVDGGAHSSTNLDLAAKAQCNLILGSAPMAWDTAMAPPRAEQLTRRFAARRLAAEVAMTRAVGAQVLLFRPTASEIRLQGHNFMRRDGWEQIAKAAYETTVRALATPRSRNVLDGLAA